MTLTSLAVFRNALIKSSRENKLELKANTVTFLQWWIIFAKKLLLTETRLTC
jgi:hypothetical protein